MTKEDYSNFYISMIIILSALIMFIVINDTLGDIEHLQKDLEFAKETGEFLIYEAEIISYCANESNLSNEELLINFLEYKSDEIINEFASGGNHEE